jgi:hypothetical protein
MSVFGTRHFGKVSIVPNLFYVATKFFHINFVPLIPLGSSVIIANSERHESGNKTIFLAKQIDFSWKSFFMAYLRLILWVTLLVSMFMFAIKLLHLLQAQGIVEGRPNRPMGIEQLTSEVAAYAATAVASAFFLYLSFRAAIASEERAMELGRLLGFPEATVREHLNGQQEKLYAWPCPRCGTINRTAKQGTGTCVRCGGAFATKQRSMAVTLLVLAAAVLFVAAVAYFNKHGR